MLERQSINPLQNPPEVKLDNWDGPIPIDTLWDNVIIDYLGKDDPATLALTQTARFFKLPNFTNAAVAAVKRLLRLTANPEEKNIEMAKKMLKQSYALMLYKSPFTEELCGQREWKKPISPLQYTAFSGDLFLRREFLQYLPDDQAIKRAAGYQLYEVLTAGTEHGVLMANYQQLVTIYKVIKEEINYHWEKKELMIDMLKKLGNAQLHSTIYLLQWLCPDVDLFPISSFYHPPKRSCLDRWDKPIDLSRSSLLGKDDIYYCGSLIYMNKAVILKYLDATELSVNSRIINRVCEVSMNSLIQDIMTLAPDLGENLQYHEENFSPKCVPNKKVPNQISADKNSRCLIL